MKLKKLQIENFRGIREMELELDPRLNVFAGKNGAGKSTILHAIALPLSAFFQQPPYYRKSHDPFGSQLDAELAVLNSDIHNKDPEACVRLFMEQNTSSDFEMRLRRNQSTGYAGTAVCEFKTSVPMVQLHEGLKDGSAPFGSLLAIRYLVDRYFDPRQRRGFREMQDPISAYFSALNCGHAYNQFFHWFRDRQTIETHRLKVPWTEAIRMLQNGEKPDGADAQLWAVRRAIEAFMDGMLALRIEYEQSGSEPVMVIDKGGRQLAVGQLSDGEQNLMALVGDLVRRLAVTNPDLDDPLRGEAVVMIDEVDLHLHPSWQRMVVPRLLNTFPNVQFLITTHSPQVLGEIRSENIILLEQTSEGIVNRRCSEEVHGMESSQILEDLMDTPARDEDVKEVVFEAFAALERNEIEAAKDAFTRLSKTAEDIPELERLAMRIRRKEALGK